MKRAYAENLRNVETKKTFQECAKEIGKLPTKKRGLEGDTGEKPGGDAKATSWLNLFGRSVKKSR